MEILQYALKILDESGPVLEKFKKNATGAGDGIGGKFLSLAGPIAATVGAIAGIGIALKKSLDSAGEMEKFTTQFSVLLGSTGEAKQRMQELAQFAAKTPFELPEVAQASKTLQTLTKGALSTGEGLTLVGDAAAGAGVPFSDMSVTIGRLYSGLQSGRPVGEAASRLQELGVLSSEARTQLELMQKEGKKGPEVWGVAAKELQNFSGMMDKQSNTFEGLASTLSDSVNMSFATFGEQILPIAKDILIDVTKALEENSDVFKTLGSVMSGVLFIAQKLFQAFVVGFNVIKLAVSSALSFVFQGLSKLAGGVSKLVDTFGKFLPESVSSGLKSASEGMKTFADENATRFDEMADSAVQSSLRSIEAFNDFSKKTEKDEKKKPKQAGKDSVGSGLSSDEIKKANDIRLKLHDDYLKAINALELNSQKTEFDRQRIQTNQEYEEKVNQAKETFSKLKVVTAEDQKTLDNTLLALEKNKNIELDNIAKDEHKNQLQLAIKATDDKIQLQEKEAKKARDNYEKMSANYKKVWDNVSGKLEGTLTAPFEGFFRNITRGNQSLASTFKGLFVGIADSFGNMLVQMAAQMAAKAAIFGLLTLLTGGTAFAGGASLSQYLFNANGTDYSPGGMTVVGERGREIVNLPRGSQVIPNNQISNNSSSDTYNLNMNLGKLTRKEMLEVGPEILRTIQKRNSYRRGS